MSNDGPHSRACGWRNHDHGTACSTNCPTCHGLDLPAGSIQGEDELGERRAVPVEPDGRVTEFAAIVREATECEGLQQWWGPDSDRMNALHELHDWLAARPSAPPTPEVWRSEEASPGAVLNDKPFVPAAPPTPDPINRKPDCAGIPAPPTPREGTEGWDEFGRVLIPKDQDARNELADLAGLTPDEKAALDRWIFDQAEKDRAPAFRPGPVDSPPAAAARPPAPPTPRQGTEYD